MKIKVMLLGKIEDCQRLERALIDEEIQYVGVVSNEVNLLDEITRTSPDIILITDASPMSLRSCNQIYLLRPRSVPVVIADILDSEITYKIMQAGTNYILPPSIDALNLISEIKGIYNNERNRITALENTNTLAFKSKVVVVFGAKDGVGKSNLVVNLAIKLANRGKKVVVLDYNMQFGDVGNLFGVEYKNTILELVQEQRIPNVDIIRQFLVLHESGVSFLPAPHSPEHYNFIGVEQQEKIISALRVYYDYVIIDVNSGFDDTTAACIEYASTILVVSGRDIPALKNTKKSLSVINALAEKSKIKLIIGRDVPSTISDSDVNRVLGAQVVASIPSEDKAMISAINQGIPITIHNPKGKISKAIDEIADIFEPNNVPIKNEIVKKNKIKIGIKKSKL